MPSALIASEDCVRGRARSGSDRARAQTSQLQFHCGKPPPAAAPKTRIRMQKDGPKLLPALLSNNRDQLAELIFSASVAVDFHTNSDFNNFRLVPAHFLVPLMPVRSFTRLTLRDIPLFNQQQSTVGPKLISGKRRPGRRPKSTGRQGVPTGSHHNTGIIIPSWPSVVLQHALISRDQDPKRASGTQNSGRSEWRRFP